MGCQSPSKFCKQLIYHHGTRSACLRTHPLSLSLSSISTGIDSGVKYIHFLATHWSNIVSETKMSAPAPNNSIAVTGQDTCGSNSSTTTTTVNPRELVKAKSLECTPTRRMSGQSGKGGYIYKDDGLLLSFSLFEYSVRPYKQKYPLVVWEASSVILFLLLLTKHLSNVVQSSIIHYWLN